MKKTAYLFAYFTGNDAAQEQLHYAVSHDGYHFTPLHHNRPVWQSTLGTGCIRDPYLFEGEDGCFYLIATDMKSSLGWDSNRNLITARSQDLIHWSEETLLAIADQYEVTKTADRVWAPQAIYDPKKQQYMIYWSMRIPSQGNKTILWYAYSRDMKTLSTEPEIFLEPESGHEAIDADIIRHRGKFYMYYKDETTKQILCAMANHANGPYQEHRVVSEGNVWVEGPCLYPLLDSDRWLLLSDAYCDGYYVMQETTDLKHFRLVSQTKYCLDFAPRHGSMVLITEEQYKRLFSLG